MLLPLRHLYKGKKRKYWKFPTFIKSYNSRINNIIFIN